MSTPSVQPQRRPTSPGVIVAFVAVGLMAIAGIATVIALAFGGGAHASSARRPASTPTVPVTPSVPATPTTPATHPTNTPTRPVVPVAPSASVEMLQRDLAQLNYYEGPIDGYYGPLTTQAVKYLQRDAHLPPTGQIDAATTNALNQMLAHGNNQMAG